MTSSDKALLLGLLMAAVATYGNDGDAPVGGAITVTANGQSSMQITDIGGDFAATVIEQADGLMVIDDSRSADFDRRAIARIQALSDKPVRFIVYRRDSRDRQTEDQAFRRVWPEVVIISPHDEGRLTVGAAMDDVLKLGRNLVQDQAGHLDLVRSISSALLQVGNAVQNVRAIYQSLLRTHLSVSFASLKQAPCHDAG